MTLSFFAIFFSIRAVHNLTDESISTRFQYRFGDDNEGNLELMAFTVCLGRFKDHKNATEYSLLQYKDTFPKLSWNTNEFIHYVLLGTYEDYAFYSSEMDGFWKPVLDWKYGLCHTFDPKEHGIFKVRIEDPGSISTHISQVLMFDVSLNK